MTRVAVIVPATNRPPTLDATIEAIHAADDGPDELIVVERPAGLGPAGARNLGAWQSSSDLFVFVDADVAMHRDALSRIRSAFAEDAELAALFGSYDDDPGHRSLVSDFRNLLHHHVHSSSGGPATTFWAGLGAVRREPFLELGGFDETRFPEPSVEDIDLGMRLVGRGFRVTLDAEVQGTHLKQWTLREIVRTDFRRRGVPWVRLLLENRSTSTALNLGWRNRVSAVASIVALASVAARRPVPAVGAVAVVLVLNRSFYLLLLRRRGWRQAMVGVPLHLVHHLVSAAAVPAGIALYVQDRLRSSRSSA